VRGTRCTHMPTATAELAERRAERVVAYFGLANWRRADLLLSPAPEDPADEATTKAGDESYPLRGLALAALS
jgi:hypothetical protein